MAELSSLGLSTAFLAGVVSFLSPCVLPLVPGYVSYVAGQSLDGLQHEAETRSKLLAAGLGLLFVLGFSTVFVALGASATALGRLLLRYRYEANIVGGGLVIAFGLFLIGVLRLSWLQRDVRPNIRLRSGHPLAAYALGLAFAFAWTPCIGPVLGAILTMTAVSATLDQGIALLSIYSLGLGLPFLAAALFTDRFLARFRAMRRLGRPLQIGAGVVMSLMGVGMITGHLSSFSFWLLDTFPGLLLVG